MLSLLVVQGADVLGGHHGAQGDDRQSGSRTGRHRGRGIGAALLAPVLDLCDEEGLPAYLESSKDSNVPYYRRFAFDVTTPFTLKGGPTLHFMWRDPEVPLT